MLSLGTNNKAVCMYLLILVNRLQMGNHTCNMCTAAPPAAAGSAAACASGRVVRCLLMKTLRHSSTLLTTSGGHGRDSGLAGGRRHFFL
jgi:hypothetical protein